MQGLYLLLTVVSVATAYVTYPSPATVDGIDCPIHAGCPAVDSPEYTVHLADKEDCHKYYKCVSGRGCLQLCPLYNQGQNRLVFNPELEVCDWPENVPKAHCNDKADTTVTKPINVPSEAEASTKPVLSTSTASPTSSTEDTPATETTSRQTATSSGTSTETTSATKPTSSNSAPSSTGSTVTPNGPSSTGSTATPNGPSSTGSTATPNVPSIVPGKCAAHGSLPVSHESDCRAYYNCHNGLRSEVQYCLEGNIFNPIQHTCDLLTNETAKYCPKPPTSA